MFRFEEPAYLYFVAAAAFIGGLLLVIQLSEEESHS